MPYLPYEVEEHAGTQEAHQRLPLTPTPFRVVLLVLTSVYPTRIQLVGMFPRSCVRQDTSVVFRNDENAFLLLL